MKTGRRVGPRIAGKYIAAGEGLASFLDEIQKGALPKGSLAVAATTELNLAASEPVLPDTLPAQSEING